MQRVGRFHGSASFAMHGTWRTNVYLPEPPMGTRLFLLEYHESITRFRFGSMNQTIIEVDDVSKLERRGRYAIVPVTTYWARERRWRDFGAIVAPPRSRSYLEVEIELAEPVDQKSIDVYALAFAVPRRSNEVLDLGRAVA